MHFGGREAEEGAEFTEIGDDSGSGWCGVDARHGDDGGGLLAVSSVPGHLLQVVLDV